MYQVVVSGGAGGGGVGGGVRGWVGGVVHVLRLGYECDKGTAEKKRK